MDLRPGGGAAGLTAAELQSACEALQVELTGSEIVDVVRLEAPRDDLILFVETPHGRRALQLAIDRGRARLCTTRRRFARRMFRTGPLPERLAQRLTGASIARIEASAGERCAEITLQRDTEQMHLVAELFGNRGMWCLLDEQRRIIELARIPGQSQRSLHPTAVYQPPASRATPAPEPPARFHGPDILQQIDELFREQDQQAEDQERRQRLRQVLDKQPRKTNDRLQGTRKRQQDAERAPKLRQQADLLLAYGFSQAPQGDVLVVPDPEDPDAELRIPFDPVKPVQAQADGLYKKARKLLDGVAIAAEQEQRWTEEQEQLQALRQGVDDADRQGLERIEARLQDLDLLPKTNTKPDPAAQRIKKLTKGEDFRRFRSTEDYLILVGRSNAQNDKLSTSIARGNDLWLHVGQGYAGSHVLVRLPKGKTASLDSILDAATLAVHFSKARGNPRCDVMYTPAKNVRKPKGLPPGKVTVAHHKTITVHGEDSRLRRLLESGAG